ncbi:5-formyltetrahydrofolate cyclo-ligase [Aquirufa rosea]|uniref:5-formyltetrahydrofolate cyclo-ligase n=1 Tax=Aquirufa rosea TaxID=2509241 RepID=A0A4Q1BZT6_9BACT|nr:5-formyltetrahydrofolate cyclo-ligase [Aquirufa rosea]RXK49660.1 5-formyltetrahydrofolate cyclo-ligase [Aquirufa rosea]
MKKKEIRNLHLSQRKSWTLQEWQSRHEQLMKNALDYLCSFPQQSIVLSFQSILDKREVETNTLHERLIKSPYLFQLAFPRVEGEGIMTAYLCRENTHWNLSNWNILEPDPSTAQKLEPTNIQVVLVPLIACDLQGHRVGFGKGFYDRYLAQCDPTCIRIGLSLEEPLEKIDDIQAWDIPLQVVISPTRVYLM